MSELAFEQSGPEIARTLIDVEPDPGSCQAYRPVPANITLNAPS